MNQNRIPLMLIFLVVFIDLLGFGIVFPVLPSFSMNVLKLNELQIGLVISIFSFFQFLFNPILGRISDTVGRRKILLFSLLLTAVGYIMFSFSRSFEMLLFSRIISGIGSSSIGVAQAYIADVTTPSERSKGMGVIGMAFGLGFTFGPMMGGFLASFGHEYSGYVSAGFSVLAFLFCLFLLPESLPKEILRANIGKRVKIQFLDIAILKRILVSPKLAFSVLSFLLVTGVSSILFGTFAILALEKYHMSDQEVGIIYTVIGLSTAVSQGVLLPIFIKRVSDKTTLLVGIGTIVIGLIGFPIAGSMEMIILFSVVYSLGSGLLVPVYVSIISKITPPEEQGSVLGVNQSLAAIGRMFGPLYGGSTYQYLGSLFPFFSGAVFALAIFVVTLLKFDNIITNREDVSV